MKYIFSLCTILILSCTKQKSMDQPQPLKAIPNATVNNKTITLTADKSEGDVCAVGWQMSTGSPAGAKVTYSPTSFIQGEKNPDGTYKSGTLQFKPITATVDKVGTYVFSLQVLDANKKESWADINVEVK